VRIALHFRAGFAQEKIKIASFVGLLRLNFNQAAALENFLLSSLRLWVKR
jgi:hypothetical protein